MAEPAKEYTSCAICARTILRGERVSDYLTPEGEHAPVCSLCRERAEALGWIPATHTGTRTRPAGGRRRRSLDVRRQLARASDAAATLLARRGEERAEPAPARAPPWAPAAPITPERLARNAIESFNSSPEARKVAGLIRSLGEPRVAVHPAPGEGTVTVTVAWELSWYRWEVASGEVAETRKGKEVSELGVAEREWNATAAEDGRLRLDPSAARRGKG